MATEPTNLRLDAETKSAAYAIFNALGIKPTQAFNLFLRQVVLQQGLPFDVKVPQDAPSVMPQAAPTTVASHTQQVNVEIPNVKAVHVATPNVNVVSAEAPQTKFPQIKDVTECGDKQTKEEKFLENISNVFDEAEGQ